MAASTKQMNAELDDFNEKSSEDSLKELRRQMQKRKKRQEQQDASVKREIGGWLVIVGGIAWLLILISFDPKDPSMFNRTSAAGFNNLMGYIGAQIAAVSYQATGFGSLLLPLTMLYMGYLFVDSRRIKDWLFQICGGLTVLFVFMTFLGSLPSFTLKGAQLYPGGALGAFLWRFLATYLNGFGAYLFLIAVAGVALLAATRLSLRDLGTRLVQAFRWLGGRILLMMGGLGTRIEELREQRTREKIIKRELERINSRDLDAEGVEKLDDPHLVERDQSDALVTPPDDDEPFVDALIHPDDILADSDAVADAPLQRHAEPMEPEHGEPESLESHARPTPSQRRKAKPQAEATEEASDIKVNQMKKQEPAVQADFQFVEDLNGAWTFPSSFLFTPPDETMNIDESELVEKAKALEGKFGEFSVTGGMREIHPGPVVTTYEFRPDAGIKYSKVVNLSDDLCLALGAESIRIDRMPGRSAIGLEVPNNKRELITFRAMIEAKEFTTAKSKLMLTLGKTIDGSPFFADLAKMPHLLIAGQTGSGKSVGINAMICSILMRARPDEVKMIMIDPKMVEMGVYRDIPHLLTPVVNDPQEASNALKWSVAEMERRYRLLADHNFRNIEHFNKTAAQGELGEEGEEPLEPLPLIVIFIDELADLMMVARGEVEESIARLAQKSRAVGIHLVLATQRPSVDIITGVIKSNLPSRLAYRVAQKNDSRIILDTNGAEKLLGKGDGLFLGPGTSRLVRIHAPFLSEAEVLDLCKFLKNQGAPTYNKEVLKSAEEGPEDIDDIASGARASSRSHDDEMYDKAARLVVRSGQASVSYLQRKLGLGYARAAKLVDMMEDEGIVGPNVGSKARDILVPADYFDGVDAQMR